MQGTVSSCNGRVWVREGGSHARHSYLESVAMGSGQVDSGRDGKVIKGHLHFLVLIPRMQIQVRQ